MTNEELISLVMQFTDGVDLSVSSANAIEVAIDDAFPEDEEMQDVVLMLASYRPGGGDFLYDAGEVRMKLLKVIERLQRE